MRTPTEQVAAALDEDVGGLPIAMDDGAGVSVADGFANFANEAEALVDGAVAGLATITPARVLWDRSPRSRSGLWPRSFAIFAWP